MKTNIFHLSAISLLAFCGVLNAQGANLYVVGDALNSGWSLDDATVLLSTSQNPDLFSGTLYLKSDASFKFLTEPDWGKPEYGTAQGAVITDGKVDLAQGSNDEGYGQLRVNESANYLITVNTSTLQATVRKADYQESEINLTSLFLVGDATEGGWSVDNGTPLYQDETKPYVYSSAVYLKEGSFKIATVLKGGGSFDSRYYYFRDANDAAKIALNQEGDLQWSITEAGTYMITVNTNANSISISNDSAVNVVGTIETDNTPVRYFNMQGMEVDNPTHGLYIRRQGEHSSKVILK